MEKIIPSVKGTRDFYPEEMAIRSWLYQLLREVSQSFGYQEYDGPFLEKIDLYAAKSGEELVKEQAFVFPDRGGDLITLRPELTPSLARMVAQRQRQLTFPLRWWSFGPFWRYERPQKGRTREFFQWNVDLIGANSPESDAELVAICVAFFRKTGLNPSQVGIFVNDRRLMDAELGKLGVNDAEMKKQVFRLIDRRDKMRAEDWAAYAIELGLNVDQFEGLKTILDNRELWKNSTEMQRFFEALQAMGADEYVHYNPQVNRGLEYYTGTVFEAYDLAKDGRAILGGGHYDNLVADVGGEPLPGVGFAMGDVMISLVLQKYGCLPPLAIAPADVLVTVFDETLLIESQKAARQLREMGLRTIAYTEVVRLPRQLKFADRMNIRFVAILGPDEAAADQITVKDLVKGEQFTTTVKEAAETIKKMLA
ncbi:MAG: histidine--tRNA ligase [Bellilinea sp.]|nr:histidine--tRNA ligase [Bellilinea sp.]